MLKKYIVGYTQDQLRYTPPCTLNSRIPIRIAKDILARNADEIYADDKLRYGQSTVIISKQGIIEIQEGSLEDVGRILSLLKGNVEVKEA